VAKSAKDVRRSLKSILEFEPMSAPRADALRNRAKVLAAAHEIFEEKGIATTTEDVAKKAGVGIGTVFRHFPTKASLFEALVEDRFDALADYAAEAERKEKNAGEALFVFLERMVKDGPAKRAMLDALRASGVDVPKRLVESPGKARIREAMLRLLDSAQRAERVRKDVDVKDVYAVLAGASAAVDHAGTDKAAAKRALRLVLDGLRRAER
jgi:AcrR family transcriptional regulator